MMKPFSNSQILISELPDWQDVQFELISSKYKTVVLIRYLILILIFVAIVCALYFANDDESNFNLLYVILGGFSFLLFLLIFNIWSLSYWGYALREKDLLYRSGIFSNSVTIIPFKQVQHVDITEGALSRLFGLSSIEVHTAGAGEGLKIPGIDRSKVNVIQEFISHKINSKSTQ